MGLAKKEEFADLLAVCSLNEVCTLEVALLFLTFLGQDVVMLRAEHWRIFSKLRA